MWKKRLLGVVGLLLLLVVGGGVGLVIYAEANTYSATAEALAALESDEQVTVLEENWLIFTPNVTTPTTGFIVYPGGLVDPRAYAPLARGIAAEGYVVVIVPMPLNLAVFNLNAADEVLADARFASVTHWAIGGHSLGGAMASAYVYGAPGAMGGLALWASYPAENNNLAGQTGLTAVSIFGTQDGLLESGVIDNSRALLPADTVFVSIEGGNHAQFGWYGAQEGDLPATIAHAEQQALTVSATAEMLGALTSQ